MVRKFYGKAGNKLSEQDDENKLKDNSTDYLSDTKKEMENYNVKDNSMDGLEKEKSRRKRKLKEELLEQHKEKLSRQKKRD